MPKPKIIPNIVLHVITVLFLAVTLSIPDHGNGSGREYGLWLCSVLYPAYYVLLGAVIGFLFPPKQLCLNSAAVYVITFLAFFLNYFTDSRTLPDLVPFSLSCVLYPLGTLIAAAFLWGCRELCREWKESHRLWTEKKNSRKS